MKKILSFLVVFSLVLSMLVSSTVMNVSAAYTKGDDGNVTYTFDTETSNLTKLFDVGEWSLSNGTDSVKLGVISDNFKNMGMNFKKFQLSAGSLNNIADPDYTLSIRGEINNTGKYGFGEDGAYKQGHAGTEIVNVAGANAIVGAIDADGDGVVDKASGKILKYTMYAYSAREDGEPINFNMVRLTEDFSTVFTVPAEDLYSENGIPHKIEFMFFHQQGYDNPASLNVGKANWVELYIDGLFYAVGNDSTTAANKDSYLMFVSPNITFVPDENNTISWKNSELYICSSPSGKTTTTNVNDIDNRSTTGKDVTAHSRDEIHSQFFQNFSFNGKVPALRSNFITGVVPNVKSGLEAAYTTEIGGDRVVQVDANIYNNPALIWNGDETNVSIVDKNGTVYKNGDEISKTFEHYYIVVNGVYAKVEKLPVSFDVSTKTAVLNTKALPKGTESLQIIVAAFDNNKLSKIKASESFSVGTSDITFEINDNDFPINAEQYKVFVFESLANGKPLVENIEINNK